MVLLIFSFLTFVSTFLGGLLALRFKDNLHLIHGFAAGAVMAVACFELLPEALEMAASHYEIESMMMALMLGFVFYLILDRAIGHQHHCGDHSHHHHGSLRAGSLSVHSFLDGLSIGMAFQVSPELGVVVALAIIAHDFSDGLNTVTMILAHGGSTQKAMQWLLADALAPICGVLIGSIIHVEEKLLALALAAFCGFFLYMGSSALIPESYHRHPTWQTTMATLAGIATLYFITTAVHVH